MPCALAPHTHTGHPTHCLPGFGCPAGVADSRGGSCPQQGQTPQHCLSVPSCPHTPSRAGTGHRPMDTPWGGGPVPAASGKGQRGTQSHEWGTRTGCKQRPGAASITPCSCTRHGASSQQGSPHPPQNAPLAASRPCPRSQRFQEGTRLCPPPPRAGGDVGKPPVSPLHPLFSPRIRHHPPLSPFTPLPALSGPRHRDPNPRHGAKNTAGAAGGRARGARGHPRHEEPAAPGTDRTPPPPGVPCPWAPGWGGDGHLLGRRGSGRGRGRSAAASRSVASCLAGHRGRRPRPWSQPRPGHRGHPHVPCLVTVSPGHRALSGAGGPAEESWWSQPGG